MKVDILTLFPEMFDAVLKTSIIGRAVNNGLVEINCVQIRDFAFNKHRQVDDYPYGGGQGEVQGTENHSQEQLSHRGVEPIRANGQTMTKRKEPRQLSWRGSFPSIFFLKKRAS